jgi:hypothetical protein
VIVTPIFWSPPGHRMSALYKLILTTYLGDVALASGQNSNVYSVATEYFGNNGQIRYQNRLGLPILDSHRLPADGCQVASTDTTGIYAGKHSGPRLTAAAGDRRLRFGGGCGVDVVAVRGFGNDRGLCPTRRKSLPWIRVMR